MLNVRIMQGAVLAVAMLLSAQAHAAFTTTHWKSNGDGLATLDTSTGKEWLDLSYTSNWQPQSVLDAMQTGGSLAGWRLPTKTEVVTLINNWFGQSWNPTNSFTIQYFGGYPHNAVGFFNSFGITKSIGEISNGHRWSAGLYFDSNGSSLLGAGAYHRNSWGDHTSSAWINESTGLSVNSINLDGRGMFLVSDGGLTMSSKDDPSLNASNPNAPFHQRPIGGSTITELKTGTIFADLELSYSGSSSFVGYKYKVNGGAEQTVVGNRLNITGLTEGTQYTIDYAAYNNSGTGDWYSTTAVTQVSAPLMAISGLLMLVMGLRRKSRK